MSSRDDAPRYYIAEGRSLEAIEDLMRQRQEWPKKAKDWARAMGGVNVITDQHSGRLYALVVSKNRKTPIPGFKDCTDKEILAASKSGRVMVFDRRTRAGRNAASSWNREVGPMPDGDRLTDELGLDRPIGFSGRRGGHYMPCVGVENIGGVWVIAVDTLHQKSPQDARPIKRSEYWKMVEDQEELGGHTCV